MSKAKTSIYVDRELWEKFKRYAKSRGVEVSSLLEELMREAMIEEELINGIVDLINSEFKELDFDPIPPREGSVSVLVRELRDERENNLFRQ